MRYVDLAETCKTPYLRVFGGGSWRDEMTPDVLARAAGTVERCRQLMRERRASCEMLLETHSVFSSATTCRNLNEILAQPLGMLWDSHHTWKLAGNPRKNPGAKSANGSATSTTRQRPGFQREGWLPLRRAGAGTFPTRALFDVLAYAGYRRGISLEWEKLWHPDLADMSEALVGFKDIIRAISP